VHGQFAQMVVAWADFDPSVGHANEGLGEIVIAKSTRAEHGARTGAMRAVDQSATTRLERRCGHSGVLLGVSSIALCLLSLTAKNWGHHRVLMMAPKLSG
jgi:hypothetical protein